MDNSEARIEQARRWVQTMDERDPDTWVRGNVLDGVEYVRDLLSQIEELKQVSYVLAEQVRTVEGWRRELEAENERLREIREFVKAEVENSPNEDI